MKATSKPVVVGIGDKQPTALRFALIEARRTGAGLRVVHSAGFVAEAPGFYVGAGIVEDFREAGQKVLDDAKHFIDQEVSSVPVTYVLTTTTPTLALEAEAGDASTLVIGADDVAWPDRLLGGAIASHMSTHARCPVVVVPERTYPTPLSGGVVIALDGDTSASGPLRFAFEHASAGDNLLHVLHAMPPGTVRKDAEAFRANVAEVLAGWTDSFPDVRVLLNFPIDDADEACVRATEHAELVVVGRPRPHSMPFALARPLATRVIKRAHCPVAVVPADFGGA
ncbi:MAG: universal stress protein [Aeromicrobium sp.]